MSVECLFSTSPLPGAHAAVELVEDVGGVRRLGPDRLEMSTSCLLAVASHAL